MPGQIDELCKLCARVREEKGFVTSKENVLEKLMLVVTEVAEAAEFARDNNYESFEENGKPEGFTEELADTCIRIFDLAGSLVLPLEKVILKKLAYNATRPRLHGRLK